MGNVDYVSEINRKYCELVEKYPESINLEISETDMSAIVDGRKFMSQQDYICLICCRLYHWLNENSISNTCKLYDLLVKFISSTRFDMTTLDDCLQIVITAAKYYVRGVLRVKVIYNL